MKAMMLCIMALVAVAAARPEQYTDRYDNTNIEELLGNSKLVQAYVACAIGKGKCTVQGRELKSHLAEALENNCAKCTEPQRSKSKIVIGHLINHEPDSWKLLVDKYDPQRKYVEKYEKELKALKA